MPDMNMTLKHAYCDVYDSDTIRITAKYVSGRNFLKTEKFPRSDRPSVTVEDSVNAADEKIHKDWQFNLRTEISERE